MFLHLYSVRRYLKQLTGVGNIAMAVQTKDTLVCQSLGWCQHFAALNCMPPAEVMQAQDRRG